jgi:Ricin-type beta-trefoil lectin domain
MEISTGKAPNASRRSASKSAHHRTIVRSSYVVTLAAAVLTLASPALAAVAAPTAAPPDHVSAVLAHEPNSAELRGVPGKVEFKRESKPLCSNCIGGTFVNMAHNLCLDAVGGGDGKNGDNVDLWGCNGGSNQFWYQPNGTNEIINGAHNLCLDAVRSGDGTDGDNVQLWSCNGGSNQQWFLIENFTWDNGAHGLCLDAVGGGDGKDGDNVDLWGCNGGGNQKWNSFAP